MTKSSDLISKLVKDYPKIKFSNDNIFKWSYSQKEIFYNPKEDNWQELLIHELGHALLNHDNYVFDRELLSMEVDAWKLAKEKLGPKYNIRIAPELIDETVFSYKAWLHQRSICPNCSQVGSQINNRIYKCLSCETKWTNNDAKFNQLKRIIKK